jgi:hypothetical protein
VGYLAREGKGLCMRRKTLSALLVVERSESLGVLCVSCSTALNGSGNGGTPSGGLVLGTNKMEKRH